MTALEEYGFTLDEVEPPREKDGYVAYVWERHFFNAFLFKYATITASAEQAGVPIELVEARLNESPVFRAQLLLCERQIKEKVDHEIIRRALEPEMIPQFYRGRIVGYIEKWDNLHLRWVAERLSPEKYHLPARTEGAGDEEVVFRMELGQGKQNEVGT